MLRLLSILGSYAFHHLSATDEPKYNLRSKVDGNFIVDSVKEPFFAEPSFEWFQSTKVRREVTKLYDFYSNQLIIFRSQTRVIVVFWR
jgi:hypothetical protein